jgi:hypothetical protein
VLPESHLDQGRLRNSGQVEAKADKCKRGTGNTTYVESQVMELYTSATSSAPLIAMSNN